MNTERSSRRGGPSADSRADRLRVDRRESRPVDVVVATPDASVKSELRARLEQHGGFVITAEKSTATQALGATLFHSPRVCLLDIDLPGGLEDRIKAMRAERPDTRIGILAQSADRPGLLGAVLAGADGVLLLSESPEAFADEVHALARGERVHPTDASEADGRGATNPPAGRASQPAGPASDPEHSRRTSHGTPLIPARPPGDGLLTASVLYVPRFSRHLRRRLQSGMSVSEAWGSARERMQRYR